MWNACLPLVIIFQYLEYNTTDWSNYNRHSPNTLSVNDRRNRRSSEHTPIAVTILLTNTRLSWGQPIFYLEWNVLLCPRISFVPQPSSFKVGILIFLITLSTVRPHCRNINQKQRLFTRVKKNVLYRLSILRISFCFQSRFAKILNRRNQQQGTKKFRSDSPGLADFVVGLVEFILYLPDGQVKVFREIFL